MKTLGKDVILLCKGYYNYDKYPGILEALKQYYRENFSDELEEILIENFFSRRYYFQL